MPRTTLPHTIDNGAGERIVFTRRVRGQCGSRLEGETTLEAGTDGTPMHVHHLQDEGFTVIEGRLGYQRAGEAPRVAAPGESVEFKAGEAHRFWNAGDGTLRCSGFIEPAGNAVYFLSELFESRRRAGGGRPRLFDVVYLTQRYGREYSVVEIPRAVQRLVFPLLVFVGVALGLFDRYKDAPAPLRG
jgi:quercetin dioxygenase-like cupin family protein